MPSNGHEERREEQLRASEDGGHKRHHEEEDRAHGEDGARALGQARTTDREGDDERGRQQDPRVGELVDPLEIDAAAGHREAHGAPEVGVDTDKELEQDDPDHDRGGDPQTEPAELAPPRGFCPRLEREDSDDRDEERAADVLLESERHRRDGAGDREAKGSRLVARREEQGDAAEDGETGIGVVERVRKDGVDAQRDERQCEDRREPIGRRHGTGQHSSRDEVREERRRAAAQRRIEDLDLVLSAEELDEERLDDELAGRLREREVAVGDVAERDA